MSDPSTVVIVGASLAGATAAATLRAEGFDGRVVLVGEEHERPYERPALSKDYLRGDAGREKSYVHSEAFYAEQRIELRTGATVRAVRPNRHAVLLDGDEEVRYDRLLLATGASARTLAVPGADLPGVHTLRTLADADRLGAGLAGGAAVVVIGAGWIGTEVAASVRQLGHEVAMVAPATFPLERVLGPEIGSVFARLHADHGVALHLGTGVEAIRGTDHVQAVVLGDGTVLAADLVVVAVGALPRVELATDAGLDVVDGVVVDARLRTSAPDVFAAGDVASAFHPDLAAHVRVEHWANALHQGPAAARSMLGDEAPYRRIPYFFSDQYEFGMEHSGHAPTWARMVLRGDPDDGAFAAFWCTGGVVAAGMHVNVWDVNDQVQRLIRDRVPVTAAQLADPEVPLEELVAP